MSEKITVQPSEGSPAAVAYKLLDKIIDYDQRGSDQWTKELILSTYEECLQAANGYARTRK